MGKRLKNISTHALDFKYGTETRQVIADTKNIKGQLWLYVNKHPDNKDLLNALYKLMPKPSAVYSMPSKVGKRNRVTFGFEFIFKKGPKAIREIRKAGFKVV